MPERYPFHYELEPKSIEKGAHWLVLTLRNRGDTVLKDINVNLSSRDTANLTVATSGEYIGELVPGEEETLPFKVSASRTTRVYAIVTAKENGGRIHWESPMIKISVAGAVAEIRGFEALTHPYPLPGRSLDAEAAVFGLRNTEDLRIEFWLEGSEGMYKQVKEEKIPLMEGGESKLYTVEITPVKEGYYTIYAYLYKGKRLVDREHESLLVLEEPPA